MTRDETADLTRTVPPAPGEPSPAQGQQARLTRYLAWGAVLAALVPIVVATIRAIQRQWVPVGDNGLIAVRARDVFSSHPPLLYTWSSASTSAGFGFNHPGPLLFDLLAVPTALSDSWAGLAVGAALLNAAAVIAIAVFAYRRGGPLLSTAATAVTAALCWTMGGSLLFDPWSPNSLLLPFLLFLLLVWSMSCGDLVALPFAAGVGSLLLGTNLAFGLLVPVLALWGLLGLSLSLRRRRSDPDSWPALRRRTVRVVAIAVGVFVLCWIQPIIEQLTGPGEGNLTRATRALGELPATLGAKQGLRLFAGAAARWMQPSSLRAPDWSFASVIVAAAVSVVGAGILVACTAIARRRRDQVAGALVVTAAVAAVAGLVSAIRTPIDPLGSLAGYQTRWLWPLGAFLTFAVVAAVARAIAPDGRRTVQLVAGFTALTLVLVVLNVPTRHDGSDAPDYTQPVVRDLNRQMVELEGIGTLLVDWHGEAPLAQSYGSAALAELERRGIPFKVQEQVLVRSLGPNRRFTGANADAELRVRTGDDADQPPRGGRRVAFHEALRPEELRELLALKRQIAVHIRAGGLRLTRRGLAAIHRLGGRLPAAPQSSTGNGSTAGNQSFDPEQLFASRALVALMQHHFLELNPRWARIFERYVHLQARRDTQTVGLFLRPVDRNRT